MDDLVKATGVSRHGIYKDFGGKHELFGACLKTYQDQVVSPAFAPVEQAGAGLREVADYFEIQIARAEKVGLPGPGCLVANTMAEIGPHDSDLAGKILQHNTRLQEGFQQALHNASIEVKHFKQANVCELAGTLTIFANGLWLMSRSISNADHLRRSVRTFLEMIKSRLEK